MQRRTFVTGVAASLALPTLRAQTLPSGPVRIIVGFAPGGGTDILARPIMAKVSERIGQQFLIDNRGGATGMLGTDLVAKAAPDGYTILLGNVGSLAVAPHLVAGLPYDPQRDLAPITMAVVFPNLIVVHPSVPASTLAELIKLAKEKPGTLTYGSSGIGGAGHLAGELLKQMAKIDLVHVPFKGGGPAMQAMLGGQISAYFATPVAAGVHVKAGKAKALATTGPRRDPFMPDVPTVAEVGYPGYQATNWYAYMAPAKTPKDIVARLHREITKALNAPEVKDLLNKQGLEPAPGSPEELARFIASEDKVWGRVVKEAGIKAQ